MDLIYIARGYSLIGQPDHAFRILRAGFEGRHYPILQIVLSPETDPLRSDPRFNELISDIGLRRHWP